MEEVFRLFLCSSSPPISFKKQVKKNTQTKMSQHFMLALCVATLMGIVALTSAGLVGLKYVLAPHHVQVLIFKNYFIFCFFNFLFNFKSGDVTFITMDPSTAKVTPVGSPLAYEAQAQQLSVVDSKNNLFYMIGFNQSTQLVHLIALNLQTAAIVSETKLPFLEAVFVGVGQSINIDPSSGDLFLSGRDPVDQLHHLYRYSPKTHQIKYITKIGDIDVMGGSSEYDPVAQILWLTYALNDTTGARRNKQRYYNGIPASSRRLTGAGTNKQMNNVNNMEIDLVGINVNTGNVVHQIKNTLYLETMNYDPVTGLIVGIGLQVYSSTNYTRILMTLNSKTGATKVISELSDYFIIDASISAFNAKTRLLYAILQPKEPEDAPFELVCVNVNTGKVVSHPQVNLQEEAQAPWSLHWA